MKEDTSGNQAAISPAAPTAKDRMAVQRAVTALLDELAPERVVKRAHTLPLPVEQIRTPNGCVLQAESAALTVSWFPEATDRGPLGELDILIWRGVVSRRGAPPRPDGATIVHELVLHPIEHPTGDALWRADDGTTFETGALTMHCLSLLDAQINSPEAGG